MKRVLPFLFLILFLGISQVETPKLIAYGYKVDDYYRFTKGPSTSSNELEIYVDKIKADKGYKIAFVGDSVVNGVFTRETQTIPVYLQHELNQTHPDVKVYNFGMPGAQINDIYLMMKYLQENQAVNEIVIDISYPFLSKEMEGEKSLYYKMFPNDLSQDLQKIGISSPPQVSKTAESRIEQVVGKFAPYHYRKDLNFIFFGDHPVTAAKGFLIQHLLHNKGVLAADEIKGSDADKITKNNDVNKYKSWLDFPLTEADIKHYQSVYNVPDLQQNPAVLIPLQRLFQYAKDHKIRLSVWQTSINMELLKKSSALNLNLYDKNAVYLKEWVNRYHYPVYSYQLDTPNADFHDSLHLLGPGNQVIGERLGKDLLLQEGEKR